MWYSTLIMKKHLKDYFIPHSGNEYKPHSLRKAAMVGMVGMVLLSFTLANVQALFWVTSDWMVSTVLPAVIVDLTNEEREDVTLSELTRNSTLDAAARMKAQHMADNEYFSHFSPSGVSPWHWFSQANYNFVHAGENLAIHFNDSDEVVEAWMDSPTHRANIVNGSYTEIGVGTAEGRFDGYKTVYVVQLFGTPAAAPSVAGVNIAEASEPETEPVIPPAPVVIPEPEPVIAEAPVAEPVSEEADVLAEAVEITETIEIQEAEPVPVITEPEDQVVLEELEVTGAGVALFSDFVSTSTGGIPASIDPGITQKIDNVPYFLEILTQPHVLLQMLYLAIGSFVLISLMLSVAIEIRRHHPVQITYSLALLLLMTGLFYIHDALRAGAVII
ncbi:MAG: hypothetical protein ACI9H6_000614 [Patiriisocius sp.]|jgi:hypothetical protein